MNQTVTLHDLKEFAEDFCADPANLTAMNAVAHNGVQASARNQIAMREDLRSFSVKLDSKTVDGEKASNYQWAYAGFHILRDKLVKKLGIEDFHFSINHFLFYDKLEKINLYFEGVLKLVDSPLDSREMEWLFTIPRSEAGEWENFASLVMKYGVVPLEVQPAAATVNQPRYVSPVLFERILGFTRDLRKGYQQGKPLEQLRQEKEEMLNTIYRMLSICYGEPVKSFEFFCTGKNQSVWRESRMTPVEFFQTYCDVGFDGYVSMVCGASGGTQPAKYELDHGYYGSVYEGQRIIYVSVPPQAMKNAAIAQLKAGEPVWFACDINERCDKGRGILDDRLLDYRSLFGTEADMSRKERFVLGQAHKNHSMVFCGVDLHYDGTPRRWLAEAAWGKEIGEKGMFLMTDGWFDRYTYQVVVRREFVPQEILDVYDGEASGVLRPWDALV